MGLADAVLVLGSNDAPLQRGLGASRKRVQTWGNLVAGDIDKAFKKGLSSLTTMTGFAGVGLFAMQAREVLAFQDGLSKLGVSARLNQYQMAALGDKIREAGVATGVSSEEILGGIQSYVALTGDVKTASESLEIFARAAQATSTPMSEIAKTAAALHMNLGITSKDMEAALSGIHSQGKQGAVEFNEMATIVGNLAPRFAQFGTVGVKGLGEMNGILQTMRVGFGTTGEAATSLEAIMGALTQGRTLKGLAGIGIKPFTVDTKGVHHMRDLRDIIAEIIKKTHGDPIVLSHIFGRKEAISGIVKLAQAGDRRDGQA
jgi:TP901 family phage tail tape measure protein